MVDSWDVLTRKFGCDGMLSTLSLFIKRHFSFSYTDNDLMVLLRNEFLLEPRNGLICVSIADRSKTNLLF